MIQQHKHISEADYRRYLGDEMSEPERNAFEKLLEKYPFEAEALEGLQQLSGRQFSRDMDDLRERISKKSRRSNRMIWWASAAAVLVLITSGILWYNLDHGVSPPPLAEQMQLGKKAESQPANKIEKKQPAATVESSKSAPEKQTPAIASHQESIVQKEEPESEEKETIIVEDDSELVIADDETFANKEQEPPTEKPETPEKPDTMEVGRNTLKTQNNVVVIQKTASPVKRLQENTASEFDFNQPERSQKGNAISAEVSGSQISSGNLAAQPMMDKEKFDAWLRENAVLDEKAAADSVVVMLNLHVDKNGKITDFTNANSADQKYYRKARKIISSGPPWQPAMMNGFPVASDAELKVVFRTK